MPSSTFNSERAVPAEHLAKVWIGAVVLAVLLLSSLELFWRSRGHVPSVVDDQELWSYWREAAADAGPDKLILLGDSRTAVGFNVQAFLERYPRYRIIDLAVDGKSPIAALKDLADDPAINGGVILCQLGETTFLPMNEGDMDDHVRHYHREWGLNKKINRRILTLLQSNFVIVNPYLGLQRLLDSLWVRRLPQPPYVVTHADRSRSADYTRADVKKQREVWIDSIHRISERSGAVSAEDWAEEVRKIRELGGRLQARGVTVVFLRYPTTGEFRALEEKYFPRERFWNPFAENVRAPTIHFEDVPSLSGFTCPDGLHLDRRDAVEFTKALGDELARRGIIR